MARWGLNKSEDAQIAAFPHLFRGHEDPPFKWKVFLFFSIRPTGGFVNDGARGFTFGQTIL
jgi:hypothetical protein